MRKIISVTGPIAPEEVGFCQFHEHIMLSRGRSYEVNPDILMDDEEKSLQEVMAFAQAGGGTIVDAQPGGCNRMAAGLAHIAGRSGVNIICSTGFHKMIFYPEDHWIHTISRDALYGYYVRELTEGVSDESDQTHPDGCRCLAIRAGIVKCALDTESLSSRYKRLFEAAAHAARDCQRPMLIHVEKGSDPLALLSFLQAEGLLADQLVFCHLDRAIPDPAVHRQILEAGAYLEFDTIGRFKYHSDEDEIALFLDLLGAGYEDGLLFSLDTTRARMQAYRADGVGLSYILKTFLPKMREAGITPEQINKIANQNAVRAFLGGR